MCQHCPVRNHQSDMGTIGQSKIYCFLRMCIFQMGCVVVTDATLLEVHLSPATWYEANRICAENYGRLMSQHFQAFAGIRNQSWFGANQTAWTGLYLLDAGFGNVPLDEDCLSPQLPGVDSTSLSLVIEANSSQRCVFVNYTPSATLDVDICNSQLPFVCENDARFQPSAFVTFYFFGTAVDLIADLTVDECIESCNGDSTLPCRAIIFLPNACFKFPHSDSLTMPPADQFITSDPTRAYYKREIYTDKISISLGQIIDRIDSEAADVKTGSTAIECELQCAWLNEGCACADYEYATCRIFTQQCLAPSLKTSNDSDAVTISKSLGNYNALFLNQDIHPETSTSSPPAQLTCQVPTPLPPTSTMLQPTPYASYSEILTTDIGDIVTDSWTSAPLTTEDIQHTIVTSGDSITVTLVQPDHATTEIFPTATSGYTTVTGIESSEPEVTLLGETKLLSEDLMLLGETTLFWEDVSVEFDDISTVLDATHAGDIAHSSISEQTESDISEPVTMLEYSSPPFSYFTPTPTLAPDTKTTYVIYRLGGITSSWFECDMTIPATAAVALSSYHATFDCTYIGAHARGLLSNDTQFIDEVVANLTIDKSQISSHRRKYTSAHDARPSARNVGILGIVMLALVFGGLILLDLTSIKRDFEMLLKNIKS